MCGWVEDAVVNKFTSLQSRSTKPETMSSLDESPDDTASSQLFFCPEEGCITSYQRFAALQHHLDFGKHERKLERETLLDKAVHGYAAVRRKSYSTKSVFASDGMGPQDQPGVKSEIYRQAKELLTEQVPYRRANRPKIERFFSCPLNDGCKTWKWRPLVYQQRILDRSADHELLFPSGI